VGKGLLLKSQVEKEIRGEKSSQVCKEWVRAVPRVVSRTGCRGDRKKKEANQSPEREQNLKGGKGRDSEGRKRLYVHPRGGEKGYKNSCQEFVTWMPYNT